MWGKVDNHCHYTIRAKNWELLEWIPAPLGLWVKREWSCLTLSLHPSVAAFLRFCPTGYFSCTIAFLQQSLGARRSFHWVQSCTVHLSHIYGSSKGCMSPDLGGICRMCLVVKRRFVWVQKEILKLRRSFQQTPPARIQKTVNLRLPLQLSDLFSLNRNQYGCSISYSGQPAPVHQTLAAVFGERVLFCVFWWTGCKAWLTLFTITDKWGALTSWEFCSREDEEQHCYFLRFNTSDHMTFSK